MAEMQDAFKDFPKVLRAVPDAHEDLFTEEEQALMTHSDLRPSVSLPQPEDPQINRELLSAAVTLYAAKLDQQQAEANERHAKAMKGLTIALLIAAGVEAAGTAVSALIQAGVF
jgi:hypothetical protein